jgi:hypothetical protein
MVRRYRRVLREAEKDLLRVGYMRLGVAGGEVDEGPTKDFRFRDTRPCGFQDSAFPLRESAP